MKEIEKNNQNYKCILKVVNIIKFKLVLKYFNYLFIKSYFLDGYFFGFFRKFEFKDVFFIR